MKDKIIGGAKDIGRRVVMKIAFMMVKHINRTVPVPELEERFGSIGKTVQITVLDKDVSLAFRIDGGKVKYVKRPKKVDANAVIDSNTFLGLIAGKRKVMDPGTGETKLEPYGPYEAYFNGDIQIYGEGVTTDYYLLFKYIWQEIQDDVQGTIGARIAGALVED